MKVFNAIKIKKMDITMASKQFLGLLPIKKTGISIYCPLLIQMHQTSYGDNRHTVSFIEAILQKIRT